MNPLKRKKLYRAALSSQSVETAPTVTETVATGATTKAAEETPAEASKPAAKERGWGKKALDNKEKK
jgi:hypothetical protein